jgi:hypothetical protein
MLLAASVDAFDILNAQNIPFLVFKGAAFQSENLPTQIRRVFGDLDILVRNSDLAAAFDALTTVGWGSGTGQSVSVLRRSLGRRIGVNLYKGDRGEIDLHSSAFHFTKKSVDAERDLWESSIETEFFQRRIRVPNVENSIVIMLAHSPFTKSGDWALEVSTRIRTQTINWDHIAWLSQVRGIQTLVYHRLNYIHGGLGVTILSDALNKLSDKPAPFPEVLKGYSMLARRDERRSLSVLLMRVIADILLSIKIYNFEERGSRRNWAVAPLRRWHLPHRTSSNAKIAHQDSMGHTALQFSRYNNERSLNVEMSVRVSAIKRSHYFEVQSNGIAIALLRLKHKGHISAFKHCKFRFDVCGRDIAIDNLKIVPVTSMPLKFDNSDVDRVNHGLVEYAVNRAYFSNRAF